MVPIGPMREALGYVTRAVLEGRYPDAIFEHPAAAAQLAGLTPQQVALWKETSETTVIKGLVAKDEGGLEVFWSTKASHVGDPGRILCRGVETAEGPPNIPLAFTQWATLLLCSLEKLTAWSGRLLLVLNALQIGGPSHGFDYEGQCLMPLVSNARHKVEDGRSSAAAISLVSVTLRKCHAYQAGARLSTVAL
jgi:hypothetical protein